MGRSAGGLRTRNAAASGGPADPDLPARRPGFAAAGRGRGPRRDARHPLSAARRNAARRGGKRMGD
ncbi:protein of unknown function [Microbacterium sp. Nx66]|nr:protein of unknown function [Microbacterium sp. Nx66]